MIDYDSNEKFVKLSTIPEECLDVNDLRTMHDHLLSHRRHTLKQTALKYKGRAERDIGGYVDTRTTIVKPKKTMIPKVPIQNRVPIVIRDYINECAKKAGIHPWAYITELVLNDMIIRIRDFKEVEY